MEIYKPVFQHCQESFDQADELFRLLHPEALLLLIIRELHDPFQMVIPVLTVCRRILQFLIGKQVETHLPYILFPQFRKDV